MLRAVRKPAAAIESDMRDIRDAQAAQLRSMKAPFASRHIPQSQKDVLQDAYLEKIAKPTGTTAPGAEVRNRASMCGSLSTHLCCQAQMSSKKAADMDLADLFDAVSAEIREREETLAQVGGVLCDAESGVVTAVCEHPSFELWVSRSRTKQNS